MSPLASESTSPVGSSARMTFGRACDGSCDGDPLLLSSGQLGRAVLSAV